MADHGCVVKVDDGQGTVETADSTAKSTHNFQVEDALTPFNTSQTGPSRAIKDPVFGIISNDGPNYRNVGWFKASVLMMKTQIGLGVLSIPSSLAIMGIVPGLICLCLIATVTTWSNYMVGVFKNNHPEVYGIDNAMALIFGKVGRELAAIAFVLFYVFVAGGGMLGISIGLNAVTGHATCTAAFVVVAAVISWAFGSIQTLGRISWLAKVGVVCILTAIFTVTIAVGIQDRPSAAPQTGIFTPDFKITNSPSFTKAISAVSALVFAYAGTPAFFNIASEMKDISQYNKALLLSQTVVTVLYITVGCIVYYFCGDYVDSPALGSAGPLVKKIAYGFALPGLLVTTMLVIHLPSKYILVRRLKGTEHLAKNTMKHNVTWFGCTFIVALIAYIIASAVPQFGPLVSLIGAFLGSAMTFQPFTAMWWYDNKNRTRTWNWYVMMCWCVFVFVAGTFVMVAGTYGSLVDIIDAYKTDGGGPWSCADNSKSS